MSYSQISQIRVDEYRLSNGMQLFAHHDPANPIICLQLYIQSGSAIETPSEYGYAHYLEHLVFKATQEYPDNTISELAGSMGLALNAFTDFDTTCFYIMLPRERLSESLKILSQMAIHASFDEEDVATERDIIIEEIYQYKSDPEMSFIEAIQESYFPISPLSHPVLGYEESLNKANLKKLRAFYKKHYRPDNAFLIASGDFEPEELHKLFERFFGQWQSQEPHSSPPPKHKYPNRLRIANFEKNGSKLIGIALPELNELHPDSEALHAAIRYLAIGKASLLHKELVEERKFCSFVKVSSISGQLSGISVILMAPTQARHGDKILDIFFKHYLEIMQNGIPASALKLVKKDMIHSWLYSFDGVEHKANLIAAEVFNKDLSRIYRYPDIVEDTDNYTIVNALRRHWIQDHIALYYQGLNGLDYKAPELLAEASLPSSLPEIKRESPKSGTQNSQTWDNNCKQEYYLFRLTGGMKVIYNHIPRRPISGFALASSLSQINEHIAGQNFFASSLLLYGTKKHSHQELMEISRAKGFNIRVQHHLDSTIFRGKCQNADLPEALGILQEILTQPVFNAKYFRMLKSASLDSIQREKEHPASYAYNRWFDLLFGKRNNLLRATGYPDELKELSLADCIEWHSGWHLGRDFSLSIVGSHDPLQIKELCEALFSCKESFAPAPAEKLKYHPQDRKYHRQYKNKEQSIIHIGGFGSPAEDRRGNTAFHILAQVLGGDLSSRFYSILREKYGFAYQTGFDFSSIEKLGFWYAYAFCDPTDYQACLRYSQDILQDVYTEGISVAELNSAQNYLIAMNRFDSESVSFRAASMASLLALGYELDYYLSREERIRQVSLEEIKHLAHSYLGKENQYIHIMV